MTMTTVAPAPYQYIHDLSHTLWDKNPELRALADRQLWQTAQEFGGAQDKLSAAADEPVIGFNRLHADLKRLSNGENPVDPRSAEALKKALDELNRLGFVASRKTPTVRSEELRVVGIPDLVGKILGNIDTIVELKVVSKIPRVPRAVDALQVLFYAIAAHSITAVQDGEVAMVIVYIQDTPGFPTRTEVVLNARALIPIARQLAA